MRDDCKISAIIPTYNRAQMLRRAIDSVLAQAYAPSEIIVIDDGSIDNTREVAELYGQAVHYVYQSNSGVSAARNRGVKEAKCEWIAFLDSDDCWVPDHLSRIVRAIGDTKGRAALYFADLQVPQDEGGNRYWVNCGFKIDGDWEFRRDAGEWALMRTQPMMLQASVLSRNAYIEIGGLPDHLRTREDTLLFYKLGLQYPVCAVAGCGTVMNSDDSFRLGQAYNSDSLVYQEATIGLYLELLASLKNISRERRQILTESLGRSYYSMGRILFRQKNYLNAFNEMAMAFRVNPSIFVKEACGSLIRNLFRPSPEGNS